MFQKWIKYPFPILSINRGEISIIINYWHRWHTINLKSCRCYTALSQSQQSTLSTLPTSHVPAHNCHLQTFIQGPCLLPMRHYTHWPQRKDSMGALLMTSPLTPEDRATHDQGRTDLDWLITTLQPKLKISRRPDFSLEKVRIILVEVLELNRSRFIKTHPHHYPNLRNSLKREGKERLESNSAQPNKEKTGGSYSAQVSQGCDQGVGETACPFGGSNGAIPSSFRWLAELTSLWLYDWGSHLFAASQMEITLTHILTSCLQFTAM